MKFARAIPVVLLSLAAGGVLAPQHARAVPAPRPGAKVAPPQARTQGATYSEWSVRWWQWDLEHPLEGHPSIDDPSFDVSSGQSGSVWFLAAPFGTVERTCTIPTGTFLFVGL